MLNISMIDCGGQQFSAIPNRWIIFDVYLRMDHFVLWHPKIPDDDDDDDDPDDGAAGGANLFAGFHLFPRLLWPWICLRNSARLCSLALS